ncbi:MAG TPA: zinc ABC transporter substrate-binding protein [Candidatus Saccharimonadia bacterium]
MKVRQMVGVGLVIALVGGVAWVAVRGPKMASAPAHRLAVAASLYPFYEAAQQVGGDKVSVTNLTPAGAEPHDYEPSPQALAGALQAKVLVYDGATLEPWVPKFLPDYKGVAVKASTGIVLLPGADENGQPAPGTTDPHFWLDPVLYQTVIDNVQAGLAQADPANAAYYAGRAADYKKQLAQLDGMFGMGLVRCQSNTMVTAHAAFAYLAARYDLKQVAIAGLSPDAEPSTAKLAEIATLVKEQHISTIFFETLTSAKLASTLAQETGAKTAALDPIEGVTKSREQSGANYLTIQGENLASLRRALTCR